MTDVFISYSREDQAIARRFAEALGRDGLSVWWDQTLKPGETFDRATEKALKDAKAVIVLWSKHSIESRWVRSEATQADRFGTLMPVMIEPCDRPIMFELTHTADLSHWKGDSRDPGWKHYLAEVRKFVRRETSNDPAPAAAAAPVAKAAGLHRLPVIAAVLVAIAMLAGGLWGWQRMSNTRQAREVIVPEVAKLVDAGDMVSAFARAREARRYVPDDPLLKSLTPLFTASYSIKSTPAGADVYVRGYGAEKEGWQHLGRTPLEQIQLPRQALRWRIEKEGFAAVERANIAPISQGPNQGFLAGVSGNLDISMKPTGEQPADMVFVQGGMPVLIWGGMAPVEVPAFFMDRNEVTNAQYKEFIDAGGYERRSLWEGLDLRRAGKPLSHEEAMRLFVDGTGRPGPANWELGTYPQGRGNYPVSGISWFEAMAYARFRGRSLPTYLHWMRAALADNEGAASLASVVAPLSNFGTAGPAPVGQFPGVGRFGTYDLFGNVREWLVNPGASGGWVIGGSWEDPVYSYRGVAPLDRLERSSSNGFRLIQYIGEPANGSVLRGALDFRPASSDPALHKPVSDEVYADYRRQLAYRPGELNATEAVTMAETEDWIKQKVTIDTGYNSERMDVILFIPKRVNPPLQPVIFFGGAQSVLFPATNENIEPGYAGMPLDFVIKSGRVLVVPSYQGTYQRFRAPYDTSDMVRTTREWIERRWDLGRTIDYLETRSDIDAGELGYVGASFGASAALPLVAVESRLKAAVLLSGGLPRRETGPLSIPAPIMHIASHAARIRIPVLMINGRFDEVFNVNDSQALFRTLGTAPPDKRYVLVDSGHGSPPRAEVLRETLGWFDKYLGEVRR